MRIEEFKNREINREKLSTITGGEDTSTQGWDIAENKEWGA